MDVRIRICFGFLISFPFVGLLVLCLTVPGLATERELYIKAESDDCTKTRLIVRLEGIRELPQTITFRILRKSNLTKKEGDVISSQKLVLKENKYIWIGVLSLTSYTAQVYDESNRILLAKATFSNERLIQKLYTNTTAEIINLRQDSDGETSITSNSRELSYIIAAISYSQDAQVIHIILINAKGELADQYLGKPIRTWKSISLPQGSYKQIIVQYDDKGICKQLKEH